MILEDPDDPAVSEQRYPQATITARYNDDNGAWMLYLSMPGKSFELGYSPEKDSVPPGEQIEDTVKNIAKGP